MRIQPIFVIIILLALCVGFQGIANAQMAGMATDINTGFSNYSLQVVIDNSATTAGDTIEVGSGVYWGGISVYKSLIIKGVDTGNGLPVFISGVDSSNIYHDGNIYVIANDTVIQGLNLTNNRFNVTSNNNTLQNNTCYIRLYWSDNNTLTNNTVNSYGIFLENSNYNNVTYNNASNYAYGICLNGSCYNNVSYNNASNNYDDGIVLSHSDYNDIIGNIANNNTLYMGLIYDGIDLYDSNYNNLIGNTANNNANGINFAGYYGYTGYGPDNNNTVIGNTANNNMGNGIVFDGSGNTIIGNTVNNNGGNGISQFTYDYGSYNNVVQNIANNNYNVGISIASYNNVNNDNVSWNTADNNGYGISIGNLNYSSVIGNTADNNSNGIGLSVLNYCYVMGNTANNTSNTNFDVYVLNYCNITGNIASYGNHGFSFSGSNNNSFTGNTASNNVGGIDVDGSNYNDLMGNTANNNQNGILFGDVSDNNNVVGNIVSNNINGITLVYSHYNNLTHNNVNNNSYGISLETASSYYPIYYSSNFNNVSGNTVDNNGYGFCLQGSPYNIFWLNTIAGNGQNVSSDGSQNSWNSTIPLNYQYNGQTYTNYTGNYWGVYNGSDANGDGIGDTPYVVDANNIDYYPMMLTVPGPSSGPVKNLRNGMTFNTIQAAINDNNTMAGDTIQVGSGTYYENVVVNKTINLIGVDTGSGLPVVNGSRYSYGNAFSITINGVALSGFGITDSYYGVYATSSYDNVSGNTVNNNNLDGIYMVGSNNSVSGNTVYGNSVGGIYLYGSNNSVSGNAVDNNGNPVNNNGYGIYLYGSNNSVSGNTANNNNGYGIDLYGTNNSVSGNTAYCNNVDGIYLSGSYGNVSDNAANNNGNPAIKTGDGIYLSGSYYSLSDNAVNNNNGYGIYLDSHSNNNCVSGNTVTGNNQYGIYMDHAYYYGYSGSSNNLLSQNSIEYNGYGIYVSGSNNVFSLNTFVNPVNVQTDGGFNYWNSTTQLQYTYNGQSYSNYTGNYWGDVNYLSYLNSGYRGIDGNGDGIGDTPYVVDTSNVDHSPMMFVGSVPCQVVVDQFGAGNYTTIQAAINAANGGDTILVHSGTYYENIVINKTVRLIGVDIGSGLPVVNGSRGGNAAGNAGNAFSITINGVALSGFGITDSYCGVYATSSYDNVSGNTVYGNNWFGISMAGSYEIVSGNVVNGNICGVTMSGSHNDFSGNTVCGNIMPSVDNYWLNPAFSGVCLDGSFNNVSGNTVTGNTYGFYLSGSNNSVSGNAASNNNGDGIDLYGSNSSVSDNTANNNGNPAIKTGDGIYLSGSNSSVSGNTANNNNCDGIYLYGSNYNSVSGNTVTGNNQYGIYLDHTYNGYYNSSNNIVSQNTIEYNGYGVYVSGSNNVFSLNTFVNPVNVQTDGGFNYWNSTTPLQYTYNGETHTNYTGNYWGDVNYLSYLNSGYRGIDGNGDGIGDTPYVVDSNNVDHSPMMFVGLVPSQVVVDQSGTGDYTTIQAAINAANGGDTILVHSGTYYENIVVNKTVRLVGVDTGSGLPVVNGSRYSNSNAFSITNNGVALSGFGITGSYYGVYSTSSYDNVSGNTVYGNNWFGISMVGSYEIVSGNVVNDNICGVALSGSHNNFTGNTVCGNIMPSIDNYWLNPQSSGVCLDGSYNNVSGNTVTGNTYGFYLSGSNNSVSGNAASNNNGDGIHLSGSNNSVSGNAVNNNGNPLISAHGYGIYLDGNSDNNSVSGNTMTGNNQYGIYITGQGNNVRQNSIENNGYGVYVSGSNNVFSLNEFVNPVNAQTTGKLNYWESTAPLRYTYNGETYTNHAGNYWGDYNGTDVNGDSIGDTSYQIDANNIDYYPIVNYPVTLASSPNNTSYTLSLKKGWNLVSSPLVVDPAVNVSAFKGTNVTMVARYNQTTGGFDIYRVGKTPVAFSFEAGQGYFLYCGNDMAYTVNGYSEPNQSTTICKGWNLIGWTNMTSSNAKLLASGLQNVTMLARYNTTMGSYDIYRVGKTPTPFTIQAGEGYFLYTSYAGQQTLVMG